MKKAAILALLITVGLELLINVPLVLRLPAEQVDEKMPLLAAQFVGFFLLQTTFFYFVAGRKS